MKALGDKWKAFGSLLLDPSVVVSFVVAVIFGWFLATQKEPSIVAILTIIVTLTSAVCGRIIARRWGELTEEKVIVARGQLSVRSLKLLWVHLASRGCRREVLCISSSGVSWNSNR